jgi:hypothetical protein
MANGAQVGQTGQGQLPPLLGSARGRRQTDGTPAGADAADGYGPRTGGGAGHAHAADDDALDTFAEVWRSRSYGGPYEADDLGDDDGPEGDALEGPNGALTVEMIRMRARIRRQLREFLRAVPRQEPDATLALVRLDGTTCLLTRGQLTAAIDHMRPRMRQIVRLAVEERWPRQRVCEYLGHISLKTVERDQSEAMDMLAQV